MNPIKLNRWDLCASSCSSKSQTSAVSWEFIIPQVFQPIISVKDRGKEGIKRLCFAYVPICEVKDLIKKWTDVMSNPCFAVNMF